MNWKTSVFLIVIGLFWMVSSHVFMRFLSMVYDWETALAIWNSNRILYRVLFNPGWGLTIAFVCAGYLGVESRNKGDCNEAD